MSCVCLTSKMFMVLVFTTVCTCRVLSLFQRLPPHRSQLLRHFPHLLCVTVRRSAVSSGRGGRKTTWSLRWLHVFTATCHLCRWRRFAWICYLAGGFWSTVTAAVACVALLLFVLNLVFIYKRKTFRGPSGDITQSTGFVEIKNKIKRSIKL